MNLKLVLILCLFAGKAITDDAHCGVYIHASEGSDEGKAKSELFFHMAQPTKAALAKKSCDTPAIKAIWATYKKQFAWGDNDIDMPGKEAYQIDFKGANEAKRFKLWCPNYWAVVAENCDADDRLASLYWWDVLTEKEYESLFHFAENEKKFKELFENTKHLYNQEKHLEEDYGSSKDWVALKKVAGIKSQGGCGSCYSFAATVALESQQVIKGGQAKDLSEQWAVNCSKRNNGCSGGFMNNVWADQIGQPTCTETELPYTGKVDTCNKSACTNVEPAVTGTAYYTGVNAVANAVYNRGPVAVAIDHKPIARYRSGILNNCTFVNHTHAVNIVGFVKDSYWLVQNSWGAAWGDKGYFKVKYGDCIGIVTHGQLPTIKTPTPSSNNTFSHSKGASGNLCTGLCGKKNSHGCSCTSGCKAAGTCCQGFDFSTQCKSESSTYEVAGTKGWCSLASWYCGYTLNNGKIKCSCGKSCKAKKNCCIGAVAACTAKWTKLLNVTAEDAENVEVDYSAEDESDA
jgi:cathepsin L